LEYAEGYKARMAVLEEKMKPIEGDGVNASNSGEKKENYEDPD
jgi:fructose 1,6-bisphosphate aldolase/phosphatase